MPAWSPEIANEFIRMAKADGRTFNQMQLQKLVYIAHGWCLAISGQPLTGDRPEAWEYGPVYRRIADALASFGSGPVTGEISLRKIYPDLSGDSSAMPSRSIPDATEGDVLRRVYKDYGCFEAFQLSAITRHVDAPWSKVFAEGAGKFRDISHELIRSQFVQLASQNSA